MAMKQAALFDMGQSTPRSVNRMPLPKLAATQSFTPFDGGLHMVSSGGDVKVVRLIRTTETEWEVAWPGMYAVVRINKKTGLLEGKSKTLKWRLSEVEHKQLLKMTTPEPKQTEIK
jgi:hypothetical protein